MGHTVDIYNLAIVSLFVEFAGLFALWMAKTPDTAIAATALSGCGFALVFPALGVEVVREVSGQGRGAALGVYTAFLDLAVGVTGPLALLTVGDLVAIFYDTYRGYRHL